MKKIPTLFNRIFEDHKIIGIEPKFHSPECRVAFYYGIPTVKLDGSCCAIINGKFYKRYDAKKGKTIPDNAIKCQDKPDATTGHLPCWVPVENKSSDKWFIRAFESTPLTGDGTYEAIGKHFNGNPYNMDTDMLVLHGSFVIKDFVKPFIYQVNDLPEYDAESALEYTKEYLQNFYHEGIVFWLNGEPVCKIKRSDFNLPWNATVYDSRSNLHKWL